MVSCHAAAVTTAAQRIVGLVVEGNVEHRAEVEVEAEQAQQLSGQAAVFGDQARVAALAELLGVGWFVADEAQARHPAAFLVDGDDRFGGAEFAQVVGELAQLPGGDDVAPEQDEAAGLQPAQARRGGRVQFGTRHPDQQQFVRFGGGGWHAPRMVRNDPGASREWLGPLRYLRAKPSTLSHEAQSRVQSSHLPGA